MSAATVAMACVSSNRSSPPQTARSRRRDRYGSFESLGFSGLPSCSGGRHLRCTSPSQQPEMAHSVELPLLPFDLNEVLVPSESKILHLYEARFLALLEESLSARKSSFVHFVLDPIAPSEQSNRISFSAEYACLVHIESVNKLEVGALVSIRGISRVKITKLVQMEPYLRGVVAPVLDNMTPDKRDVDSKLSELRESISDLHKLQIKLKVPEKEFLQTNINSSVHWAENGKYAEFDEAFVPELAERVSFAAFQSVSGMSAAEVLDLQEEKVKAMHTKDTLERLVRGIELVRQNVRMTAARLALQSL